MGADGMVVIPYDRVLVGKYEMALLKRLEYFFRLSQRHECSVLADPADIRLEVALFDIRIAVIFWLLVRVGFITCAVLLIPVYCWSICGTSRLFPDAS